MPETSGDTSQQMPEESKRNAELLHKGVEVIDKIILADEIVRRKDSLAEQGLTKHITDLLVLSQHAGQDGVVGLLEGLSLLARHGNENMTFLLEEMANALRRVRNL